MPSAERNQLLALVVHIGLGEDTTWQGYTPWAVVRSCARAVEALLPDLTAWALEGTHEARTWALALAAYNPDSWISLGVDVVQLMPGIDTATVHLVRHATSGTIPAETLIDTILASDDDLREYYQEVIAEVPQNRQARQLVLELAVAGRL
ncbi:hypothetical protein [Kribbella hippodromi]